MTNTETRFFHFYITVHDANYGRPVNKTVGVVAVDVPQGLEMIENRYPGAKVWSVNHRGKVDCNIVEYDLGNGLHSENEAK